jgi:mannosyl-3-phosphoglycerate phosphatase
MKPSIIIFTDLDGTLLDNKYSFRKALPAIRRVRELDIPLVLCSSKTFAEIEVINEKLHNKAPFITENGGGIFIPLRYGLKTGNESIVEGRNDIYRVIRLGAKYEDLRSVICTLKQEGFRINGFGDMTAGEISRLTGLGIRQAALAKKRDFDEPFIYNDVPAKLPLMKRRITMMGFRYTEGELFHVMGNSDKGRAVRLLTGLFKKKYGNIVTIGIGDSPNDVEMLRSVEYPVLVKKSTGRWHPGVRLRKLKRIDGIGPEGWNMTVLQLLETLIG